MALKYQLGAAIGQGSFGKVYKCLHTATQTTYAVKVIPLDDSEDLESLLREIRILSDVRSPYLTRYFETFLMGSDMWVVLEYCGGGSCGDLLRVFKRLGEGAVAFIAERALRGLQYLHSNNLVHRDVKLQNLLITSDGEVKLGDFGVSAEVTFTRTKRKTLVGTPHWIAPEVILGNPYNTRADIWLFGITVYELLCGAPPLADRPPMKALFEIPRLPAPEIKEGSAELKEFMRCCLNKTPSNRPDCGRLLTLNFVADVLQHELRLLLKVRRERLTARRKKEKKDTIKWRFDTEPCPGGANAQRVFQALGNMMQRASLDETRELVRHIRREIMKADRDHSGFCRAFVEEIVGLMEK